MSELFGPNPFASALAGLHGRQAQYAENKARNAWSYASFTTTGSGEFAIREVVPFSMAFTGQPVVSHGYSLVPDSGDLVKTRYPRAYGGVSRWQIDARGFYVGCFVFFVVDTSGPDTDPGDSIYSPPPAYQLQHSFTFAGVAVKSLPEALLDE